MTADQTLAALRKWDVKVREYPGWRTRGRPGGIKDARGIVIHHTGSSSQTDDYLNFLFVRGRPEDGIPGPLCNVSTDMDGDLHLGAIGRANHAGSGSLTTLNHVSAQNYNGYAAELRPGPDNVDGNDYYYGNEIRYDGTRAMSAAAYRTALLHAAAICDFYGWSALSVIGHKEHTRRKDDPGHCLMNRFRTDLAAVLRAGPGDDMANADEVLAELRRFEAAEAQRYADLAARVQGLINQEAGRYADYLRRFDAILKALPNATLDPVPDPADPQDPADPNDPADPADPNDPADPKDPADPSRPGPS